jgi:hypothetical protein
MAMSRVLDARYWSLEKNGSGRTAKLEVEGPRLKRKKAFMTLSFASYVLWFFLTSAFRIPHSEFKTLSSVF